MLSVAGSRGGARKRTAKGLAYKEPGPSQGSSLDLGSLKKEMRSGGLRGQEASGPEPALTGMVHTRLPSVSYNFPLA